MKTPSFGKEVEMKIKNYQKTISIISLLFMVIVFIGGLIAVYCFPDKANEISYASGCLLIVDALFVLFTDKD